MPASKATEDLFPRGHARGLPFSRKDSEVNQGRRGKKRRRQTVREAQRAKVKTAPPKGTDILAVSGSQKVEVTEAPKRQKKVTQAVPPKSEEKASLLPTPKQKKPETSVYFKAVVNNFDPSYGITVELPKRCRPKGHKKVCTGFVSLCDINEDFDQVSTVGSDLKKGSTIEARIVAVSKSDEKNVKIGKHLCLTMRREEDATNAKDALITMSETPLDVGRKIRGFVHSVSKLGCFLEIGRGVRAYVKLSDLSDNYIQKPEDSFKPGTVVSGKVCEAEGAKSTNGLVSVTLRTKKKVPKKSKEDIKVEEGNVVNCTVKRVERYGAVVELTESGKRALLHNSEAHDLQKVEDPNVEWHVGQSLTVVVIGTNEKGLKVGTKKSYLQAAGLSEEEVESVLDGNSSGNSEEPTVKKRKIDLDSVLDISEAVEDDSDEDPADDDHQEMSDVKPDVEVKNGIADDGDSCNKEETTATQTKTKPKKTRKSIRKLDSDEDSDEDDTPVLAINHSFSAVTDKDTKANESDDEDESDEEKDNSGTKTKSSDTEEETATVRKRKTAKERKERKRAMEAAEREIRLKEEALASNAQGPQSAEEFERMLLAEPNSSVIWIQYMAFRLGLVQVEKARAIAERALETIEVEKELDRVNVWIAYINMEANYGAGADSTSELRATAVLRVFDRAVKRVNDALDFHLRVSASLRELELKEMAEEILKRAIRQFKSAKKVWIHAGQVKFQSGDAAGARKLQERALLSLEKRDHVSLIMKVSQFEYKYGSVEKGRTVFESLIGNYPKRLDIWNVFLDMETGICRQEEEDSDGYVEAVGSTRLVFERCACLELSSKKMKSVFKKWLSFEKEFGDEDTHKAALQRAREFVESKNGPVEE